MSHLGDNGAKIATELMCSVSNHTSMFNLVGLKDLDHENFTVRVTGFPIDWFTSTVEPRYKEVGYNKTSFLNCITR